MAKISNERKKLIDRVWELFYLGYPSYEIAKQLHITEAEVIKILYPNK